MDTIKKKYDIHERIGKGAFGEIFRITNKEVKTEYILKQLIDKNKYENEINFLKNVKGKNILNIIENYQDDENFYYYIILEKMDGDLKKLVEEKYKKGM